MDLSTCYEYQPGQHQPILKLRFFILLVLPYVGGLIVWAAMLRSAREKWELEMEKATQEGNPGTSGKSNDQTDTPITMAHPTVHEERQLILAYTINILLVIGTACYILFYNLQSSFRSELSALLLLVVWLVGCAASRSCISPQCQRQRYFIDIASGFGTIVGMPVGLAICG